MEALTLQGSLSCYVFEVLTRADVLWDHVIVIIIISVIPVIPFTKYIFSIFLNIA